jgi:hypothetical protein
MYLEVPAYDTHQMPIRVELQVGNDWEEPPQPPAPPEPPDLRGAIRIHKFLDTNRSGIQDSPEFNMQNVTFELYNADKTVLIQSKKTAADGDLTFSNLKMGTYYLRENSEYEITSPEFGADGFSKLPVILNSTQTIVFKVGNYRNTVETTPPTEVIPPESPPIGSPPLGPPLEPPDGPPIGPPHDEPPEETIVDEPPPLGLPPTGEVPPDQLYVLGALLMVAGMFLKRLN